MATEVIQQHAPTRLSAEDFETASIRSAAPSYISEVPSYHSTPPPPNESAPAYTPAAATAPCVSSSTPRSHMPPTPAPPAVSTTSPFTPGAGLPRIPSPPRRQQQMPQLSEFRVPTWSSMSSNPNARHYHRVAHRRVSAASDSTRTAQVEGAMRTVLGRINEERNRVRPLEDPYLVGEEAAAKARRERLARESGDEILIQENLRWDWFLAQLKERDSRDQSWKKFREQVERGQGRSRLARLAHLGH